jgi:peptidoglycan-associated lipoprotein
MFIIRNKLNFLIVVIFLSSCSNMNITEEKVNSGDVKTVEARSLNNENIRYDSMAVFANATIYFEFDKSSLTSKSIQTLKSAVNALNDNSSIQITLAGHADERGTREYNLALGQRRAESVSDYLVLNGISKSRITVKSFGEERPAVSGQNEESYAKNRRVEIN